MTEKFRIWIHTHSVLNMKYYQYMRLEGTSFHSWRLFISTWFMAVVLVEKWFFQQNILGAESRERLCLF